MTEISSEPKTRLIKLEVLLFHGLWLSVAVPPDLLSEKIKDIVTYGVTDPDHNTHYPPNKVELIRWS